MTTVVVQLLLLTIILCMQQQCVGAQQPLPTTIRLDTGNFEQISQNLTSTMDRLTQAITVFSSVMNDTIPALSLSLNTSIGGLRNTLQTSISDDLTPSIRTMTTSMSAQVGAAASTLDSAGGIIQGLSTTMDVNLQNLNTKLQQLPGSFDTVLSNGVAGVDRTVQSFTQDANGMLQRVEAQVALARMLLDDTIVPEINQTQALVYDTVTEATVMVNSLVGTAYQAMTIGFGIITLVWITFMVVAVGCFKGLSCTTTGGGGNKDV